MICGWVPSPESKLENEYDLVTEERKEEIFLWHYPVPVQVNIFGGYIYPKNVRVTDLGWLVYELYTQ